MSVDPYQYVVLRLVPRVEREEFVNVGVVVHCQARDYLDGVFHLDPDRVRAVDPQVDLEAVSAALEQVCRVARGEHLPTDPRFARPGPRFGWLSAPRSTIVQPGPVHGGTTEDPAAVLQHLLRRLVLPPDDRSGRWLGSES